MQVDDHQHAMSVAAPAALMMSSMHSNYLSTPKTSVLGPKRVACDSCRKRRIRCKHKDLVTTVSPPPPSNQLWSPQERAFHAELAQDLGENITITPTHAPYIGLDGDENDYRENGAMPGTNAYVNANIPMTMNGVQMFGEVPKPRGRSKACYECKKSKVSLPPLH